MTARIDVGVDAWGGRFPNPQVLRAEVDAMVEAIVGALIDNLGKEIEGLWLKGSAAKPWETPIDYVPELSDVDIHYRVSKSQGSAGLEDLDRALALHREIARRFNAAQPSPIHVPRPQFISVDQIEQLSDYIPSPAATVQTLHGAPPSTPLTIDEAAVRAIDARSLLEAGHPDFLRKAISDLVERPGRHLYTALRHLNWRVSPAATRALSVLGVDYSSAWSANRSQAVRLLRLQDEVELADQFSAYYEGGWEFFLSNWCDEDAGRAAFSAGVKVLRQGAEIADRLPRS